LFVLIIALAVTVIVISLKFPDKKDENGTDAILARGRAGLMELRRMNVRVKNMEISKTAGEICTTVERILRVLKENPSAIPSSRQVLNYYLPTLGSILTRFVRMEQSGVPIAEPTRLTLECLSDIRRAMDKQYAGLIEGDAFDLSVEMEALKLACQRDGLLEEAAAGNDDQNGALTM
jgi:5-bromo-4-chloroindolyl phosphate hydrolysis protein